MQFSQILFAILFLCTALAEAREAFEIKGARDTRFASLTGLAIDKNDNVYFSMLTPPYVFKLTTGGELSVVAGNGTKAIGGDGGPAANATLKAPGDLAIDSKGVLYIADDRFIRKIDTAGVITTCAGNGGVPSNRFKDGPALETPVGNPNDLVCSPLTDELHFADEARDRIFRLTKSGQIQCIAGIGISAVNAKPEQKGEGPATQRVVSAPVGLAIDAKGRLYIAEQMEAWKMPSRIWSVDTRGTLTAFAGGIDIGFKGDGGPARNASFNNIYALYVDKTGNLLVADNNNGRIRKIDAKGVISTVAGPPPEIVGEKSYGMFSGNGKAALGCTFYSLGPMVENSAGELIFRDSGYIRKINSRGIVETLAGK